MINLLLWISFTLLFQDISEAQPSGYFRNPLDIPISLSANFGEVRTDHFHTGFDIRTNGRTGLNVYAAADGYVSRIKVSAGGFGNALYIKHPNGYMTVYGHLEKFNDAIGKFVREEQYAKQSFEVELFPDATRFPVKKGDLIALSGNSGSSGGPHLHFEIRDGSGETYPLNPASFLKIDDTIAPVFEKLWIYPLNAKSSQPLKFSVKRIASGFKPEKDSITVDAPLIGIGVEANDYMNHAANDYGLFELSATADGRMTYSVKFDRLDFANGRFVNAYIDYPEKRKSGTIIQRLFKLEGDLNSIYHDLLNDGKILLSDTLFHKITIRAVDAYGKTAVLNFYLKYSGKKQIIDLATQPGRLFSYNEANKFSTDSIRISLPANILYQDIDFQYSAVSNNNANRFSAEHHVHNAFTPVHGFYEISLLPDYIPAMLRSKAVIVYENEKGGRNSKTSHWEGNWLVARAREFGDFYVMLDTVKPKVAPSGVKQNQLVTSNSIRFTISDNLSGIVSYKGILDGKWILMEYDPKNDSLSCELDENLSGGEHSLKVSVTDDVKNETAYTLKFRR